MMATMLVTISDDGRHIHIDFGSQALDANGLSELIAQLANLRRQMKPDLHQVASPLESGGQLHPDSISPRMDFALLEQDPRRVVLAIALDGLGWHAILLEPEEAATIGRRLLALSPVDPH